MEEDCRHTDEDPLDSSHGLHGVLRYKRESKEPSTSFQPSRDQPVLCEFCGMAVKPSLDPYCKELTDVCCLKYKEMFEELAREKRLVLELREDRPPVKTVTAEKDEQLGAEGGDSEENKEAQAKLATEIMFHTKTISFRLSCCDPADKRLAVNEFDEEKNPEMLEWNDPSEAELAEFGLNHHQDGVHFIQKFYSNGNKFLTGFTDGSAQVFYPSGNLAIILLTSEKERECIVRDDISSPCPVRALFQSNGRATCYHSNGSVWLNIDMWGGQSLDEAGARTRRWIWSDLSQTPSPLRPIFLSLNKIVGVRVLGRQCIFVSFLTLGQQAKFSVGSCLKLMANSSPPHSPSMCKEELFLLACRVHIQLTLTRMRWCLRFPSSSRNHIIKPTPVLLSLAQRLLSISHSMPLKDSERTFIQQCLQDCQ